MIGFTTYVDDSYVAPPTLEEMVAALTQPQKGQILNLYADHIPSGRAKYTVGTSEATIDALYHVMAEIETECTTHMRGEVIVDPGDPEGEPPVPPTYNTPPVDDTELKSIVSAIIAGRYPLVFTEAEINTVIDKIILVSKIDVNGDYAGLWADYASTVIL